jgi:hypothetical protein
MARVLCTLPNAAENISGVRFTATDSGMLSEPVSDAQAKRLASIPGYRLVPDARQTLPLAKPKSPP